MSLFLTLLFGGIFCSGEDAGEGDEDGSGDEVSSQCSKGGSSSNEEDEG